MTLTSPGSKRSSGRNQASPMGAYYDAVYRSPPLTCRASASHTDIWPAPSLNWLMNSRKTVYTNSENALMRGMSRQQPATATALGQPGVA